MMTRATLLMLAVLVPTAGASAQQGRAALRTCEDVHRSCVARADPRYVGGCDGYYEEAKRTGVWPAYRQNAAFACAR